MPKSHTSEDTSTKIPPVEAQIHEAMEYMDWNKIHKVMKFLDWRWVTSVSTPGSVPSAEEIKASALAQITKCAEQWKAKKNRGYVISRSGGLECSCRDGIVEIVFSIEDYHWSL